MRRQSAQVREGNWAGRCSPLTPQRPQDLLHGGALRQMALACGAAVPRLPRSQPLPTLSPSISGRHAGGSGIARWGGRGPSGGRAGADSCPAPLQAAAGPAGGPRAPAPRGQATAAGDGAPAGRRGDTGGGGRRRGRCLVARGEGCGHRQKGGDRGRRPRRRADGALPGAAGAWAQAAVWGEQACRRGAQHEAGSCARSPALWPPLLPPPAGLARGRL